MQIQKTPVDKITVLDITENCGYSKTTFYRLFKGKSAVILGVSKDSVETHKKFEEEHGLPVTLLSDTGLEVIRAYDVLKPGKDGKPAKSLIRTTYLIDEDGTIIKAFGSVKPSENAAQMLETIS